ncbi:hypothetical protein Mycch_2606 [Mycolicibacterium chubuense NBB4]|uniref:Transmembrane protein n=1 Tax=Mycolicibacterium chubuense (strain NBB4) TaxID=710421 RepID=I4BJC1_MYCCN|nr:hypothetical protein Mycch_2606 [Mycolicibacterium chubuense NBB4]
MFGLITRVVRVRATLCYAVLLSAVAAVMVRMDPHMQTVLIKQASTNLHNLSHGRLGTLLGSAFVVDAGPIYYWLPGLVCLLAVVELLWGTGRLVLAFGVGHIGATLLVAAGLLTAVTLGWVPHSVVHSSDVGMSYGAMAVLGVLTAAIPQRWRPTWLGWWLSMAAVVAASGQSFTDMGHVVALLLGMALATRFRAPVRWTVPTAVLCGLGGSFGFLILGDGMVSLLTGTAWGALGALTCGAFARLRMRPVVPSCQSA